MSERNPNSELSRRWFEEVWNQRRSELVEELLTPTSVGHVEGGDVIGIESFKAFRGELLRIFPDLKLDVEAIVAEGDNVVVRWRATGTHQGDGFGSPPTNKAVSFGGMTWHRYKEGRLVEGWDSWNELALLKQLQGG